MNVLEEVKGAETVGITGHIRPDGDCIGSCMGLYSYLKDNCPQLDVTVYLETPGSEFHYIRDIDKIQTIPDIKKEYDVFFVLDCSSLDRIEPFHSCFENAKKTVCIDHHISNPGFADINHVRGDVSSCCEVLYGLLDADKVDRPVAAAIYTGMIHDTGVFQYSSTSPETMRIAGELMKTGFEFNRIIDQSFYEKTYIQNQVMGRVLAESILLMNGACIIGYLRKKDMEFYGVDGKDLDGIVSQLRLTKGVEVAMFLYETFKVSLRSNGHVDVSRIAVYFGGGGHTRAAGCDLQGSMYDVINNVTREIERQICTEKVR